MTNYNRQKLQDDIFRMYASVIDSSPNKARDAPVEITIIKHALTGGGLYSEIDFETELKYLIDAGYFQRYGSSNIIPTINGIDKIWGSTSHLPQNISQQKEDSEIVKLQPEFYGVGINLKAIWQRLKKIVRK